MSVQSFVKEYPSAPWNAVWGVAVSSLVYGAIAWLGALTFWEQIAIAVLIFVLIIVFTLWVGYMKKNYGLDLLGFIKDMVSLAIGKVTGASPAVDDTITTPPAVSTDYPLWPGVSYIVYEGAVAAFMDEATYSGQQIKGYPAGKRYIPIITKYGEEMQGRFCPDDGIIYGVVDDVFSDERAQDAIAYQVLKAKVIDAFNSQCPVTYRGSVFVSATGADYNQLILPYVQSLGLTESQYAAKYYVPK